MNITEKEMTKILRDRGYGIIPPDQFRIDMGNEFRKIWNLVSEYTMTSMERGFALYNAVRYTIDEGVEGDFVECGVWKGGSCMLIALTLLDMGVTDRRILLYDTFSGMTEPGDNDFIAWNGRSVHEKWTEDRLGLKNNFTSWSVGLETVKKNISLTSYPAGNIEFIEGPVEETLKTSFPEKICLLRLDTDWYDSTRAELEVLYPLVSRSGVMILDDYGHFTGARLAVDEYFRVHKPAPLLNRIDYTGRICIKT